MSNANFRGTNLVKGYYLSPEAAGPRIIDSNTKIEEKLERIRMVLPEAQIDYASYEYSEETTGEFVGGLDASMLDALVGDDYSEEYDEEGNPVSNVIKANPVQEEVYEPEPVYEGPSPEEIIAEANGEAESIRVEAAREAEHLRTVAREEGYRDGYEEGLANARAEIEGAWAELDAAKEAFTKERDDIISELEPRFVSVITEIYEKVFEVNLSEEKRLVTNLLHGAMCHIESSKNYLIHVSREDHEYVVEHRNELLTTSMPDDVTIDIVEDITMKQGDCMIETANGIFDCSLGSQLEALKKKLTLLSFAP